MNAKNKANNSNISRLSLEIVIIWIMIFLMNAMCNSATFSTYHDSIHATNFLQNNYKNCSAFKDCLKNCSEKKIVNKSPDLFPFTGKYRNSSTWIGGTQYYSPYSRIVECENNCKVEINPACDAKLSKEPVPKEVRRDDY